MGNVKEGEYAMKMLYIIDRTARMHGYELAPSLKVKVGSDELTLTPENTYTERFHDAMINDEVITVYGTRNITSFRGCNLIGVQASN